MMKELATEVALALQCEGGTPMRLSSPMWSVTQASKTRRQVSRLQEESQASILICPCGKSPGIQGPLAWARAVGVRWAVPKKAASVLSALEEESSCC